MGDSLKLTDGRTIPALLPKIRLGWLKSRINIKHPSLFISSIGDDKSFVTLVTPCVNVIKLFFFIANEEAK